MKSSSEKNPEFLVSQGLARMIHLLPKAVGIFLLALCAGADLAAGDGLQRGDIVAICGDSITRQSLYSAFVETYLLACQPVKDIQVHQFGVNSERSWDFLSRMDSDVLPFRPTVATLLYGMNDGGYTSADPARQFRYRDAVEEAVRRLKRGGVRFIVIGSPGAVDTYTFDRYMAADVSAREYNEETLAGLAEIARRVSAQQGVVYADVHEIFSAAMARAKAVFGAAYHVAGADGVHPARNGHLLIAYAFLKALGCEGEIGSITVDLANNLATSTEGHRVLSVSDGTVRIESTRYPFCFSGKPENPDGTLGIVHFLPFNADLNRFRLVVNGAGADALRVTWGEASKIFSADELRRGINLAGEFLENPFSEPFTSVESAVRRKQEFETQGLGRWFQQSDGRGNLPTLDAERARSLEAEARAAVKPVRHTLKIEPAP